ncbi:MAG: HIT family protein [bacterium]
MSECIFCKIVRGDIPSYKIYEDDKVSAFLDIMPANKGHVLVVPRDHYENMLDAPEEVLCNIMAVIKKIVPSILKSVNAEGFNLGLNNGEIAGQAVSHLHFHIMPRFSNDGHRLFEPGAYNSGEAEEIQEAIKTNLKEMKKK